MNVNTPEDWRFWFQLQTDATKHTIRTMVDKLVSEGMSHAYAMKVAYDMIHGTDSEVIVRRIN